MSKVKEKESKLSKEEIIAESASVQDGGSSSDSSFGQSWLKNKNLIGGGLVAILIIVGGIFLYQYQQKGKNAEAEEQIIGAFKNFEKDSLDKAVKGSAQYYGLQKMVDEYGSTKIGNMSKYMLGVSYLAQGKVPEGQESLESFSKSDNMLSAVATASAAYAFEEQNKFEEAAKAYKKASTIVENQFTSSDYLLSAARCYEEAGKKAEALETYKEIKRLYPTSEAGKNVDKYIVRLSE